MPGCTIHKPKHFSANVEASGGSITRSLEQQRAVNYALRMTTPTDQQIAALSAALDTFARRFKLADTGLEKPLTELDKQVLFYVKKHPSCGPSDVARFLGVAMTTISSATDRLAKRGLLERHRPEGDRRAVALQLSTSGEDYVALQERMYNDMFRMMLERLSPSERESFIAMMSKIAKSEY